MTRAAEESISALSSAKVAKGIELQIMPGKGWASRVIVDGVDISHHVYRMVVLVDASKCTRVRLSCYHMSGEKYVIRGRLVEE